MKDLLLKVKDYIEDAEETIDNEHGLIRNVEKIIADGDMPDVYDEVLKALENL
ncbi:MAG TPA: hypothetical protein VIM70_14215 [Clostridium sp.]|uniref:hypothetical protein n=1 Tax=Clostridium sp. TaxID=1506 RepID=UPI002F93D0D0